MPNVFGVGRGLVAIRPPVNNLRLNALLRGGETVRVRLITVRRTDGDLALDVVRAAFRATRDLVVLVRVDLFVDTLRAVRPDLFDVVRFVELRRLVDLFALDRLRELDLRLDDLRLDDLRLDDLRRAIISLSP